VICSFAVPETTLRWTQALAALSYPFIFRTVASDVMELDQIIFRLNDLTLPPFALAEYLEETILKTKT
jgi:hypothetical protein